MLYVSGQESAYVSCILESYSVGCAGKYHVVCAAVAQVDRMIAIAVAGLLSPKRGRVLSVWLASSDIDLAGWRGDRHEFSMHNPHGQR
jgi:hypothetical protein